MLKNIILIVIFLFTIIFFYFVVRTYLSDTQKLKVEKKRETISDKIKNNISELPVLANDTSNVIEFNSGFKNEKNKTERNFWKLFLKKL